MTEDSSPDLGDVWRFPFLWSREAARGETEGRKDRPVLLSLLVRNRKDDLVVLMVPVTSVPQRGPYSIAVPDIEKRRAGLDIHIGSFSPPYKLAYFTTSAPTFRRPCKTLTISMFWPDMR